MTLRPPKNNPSAVTFEDNSPKDRVDQESRWDKLMKEALQNNGAAYETLLTDVSAALRRRLVRRLRSPEDVEDVVQEVLLAVHKARHTYHLSRKFAPWMYAIAKYKIHDLLRSHYGRAKMLKGFPANEESQDDEVRHLARSELGNAMRTLSPQQKTIVTMMGMYDQSAPEVAKRTGISPISVKVGLHRAYQKLRDTIRSERINED